jgi:hypothetical protein
MTNPEPALSEGRGPLRLAALSAALIVLVTYALTAAPGTVLLESNAELAVAARHLGCAHSPGYPLHSLTGRLACALGAGDPVFAVNLLSAFFGALTVFFLALVLGELGVETILAAGGGLLFGLSATYWTQAGQTEVYTLHLALTAAALLFALRLRNGAVGERPDNRTAVALGLVVGLLLTSHNAALTYLPALALIAFPGLKGLRAGGWGLVVAAALLGLSSYLYLPLRAATGPPINWAGADHVAGFWRGLTQSAYASRGLAREGAVLAGQLGWIGESWWRDLAPGLLPLGLAGLAVLHKRRGVLGGLLLLMVLPALGLLLTHNQPAAELRGSDETFLITGALTAVLGLVLGLDWLRKRSGSAAGRWAAPLLLAAAVVGTALSSAPRAVLNESELSEAAGADLLANAPRDALLAVAVLPSDGLYFDVLVKRRVRDRRPDLAASSVHLITAPWYQRELYDRSGLRLPPPQWQAGLHEAVAARLPPYQAQAVIARELLSAAAEGNGRPLALAVGGRYWEDYLTADGSRGGFRPYGLLELRPAPGERPPSDHVRLPAYWRYPGPEPLTKYERALADFYARRRRLNALAGP